MSDMKKEDMNLVFVGHVDHGKSTIIGRMLADTNSLPLGKLEQVKETCRRNSKPFEYAFLLDALKDEQAQGITIDSARCFFQTKKRNYIIIDAPGHIEFLKNMVTGASRAEAALLVIDAAEGVRENSKRHGYLLSMLGIKQITVLVNKMDLVDYSEEVFQKIREEYSSFLKQIKIEPNLFIPISGFEGDNVASLSDKMSWYSGQTVLDSLDAFQKEKAPVYQPFRMPVQDIYKFTRDGDNRRIVSGTISSGKIKAGDEVVFYPSGKRSKIKTLEIFNAALPECYSAGEAAGFTLEEQIYIKRGEMAVAAAEKQPQVTTRIQTNLFWLGRKSMIPTKTYYLKIGTEKVGVTIEKILRVLDASTLEEIQKDQIDRHDVAECILKTDRAVSFDLIEDIQETSRFVIIDDYEITGGGIITESLSDAQSWVREKVFVRESKWVKSEISSYQRSERYNQKSALIIITGEKDVGKKRLAKSLEKNLFLDGKIVYYLGIGSLLYGIDADLKDANQMNSREEHLRRLGELSNILLDCGVILILTAVELSKEEFDMINTSIEIDNTEIIWIGKNITTDIEYDLRFDYVENEQDYAGMIKERLQNRGIIFKP
ncbi:MAG: GTP-binding protein [Spirochaetes bacterium]|nr:GTP-binding protein [Spirochaetota bacterium]